MRYFKLILFILLSNIVYSQQVTLECYHNDTLNNIDCDVCTDTGDVEMFTGVIVQEIFSNGDTNRTKIYFPYGAKIRPQDVLLFDNKGHTKLFNIDSTEYSYSEMLDWFYTCHYPDTFDTDSQSVYLLGDTLHITRGNYVVLKPIDTDSQSLSLVNDTLRISRGNFVTLEDFFQIIDTFYWNPVVDSLYIKLINDPVTWRVYIEPSTLTDTDIQRSDTFQIINDTLFHSLQRDGVNADFVVLTPYLDNTDSQKVIQFYRNIDTVFLQISNDVIHFFILPDYPDEDSQSLYITNDTLHITRGNFVDLIPYLDDTDTDTDSQSIYILNDTLHISRGNFVDLIPYLDDTDTDTDSQSIRLSGDTLFISRGNFVLLDAFLTDTDTDDQFIDTFAIVNNRLRISVFDDLINYLDVDLTPYLDNTDSQYYIHSGTSSYTNTLFGSGGSAFTLQGSTGISLSHVAGVTTFSVSDESASNEIQQLASSGSGELLSTLSLGGGSINIKPGNGISMLRSGTALDGIITIHAIDESASNELQVFSHSGTGELLSTLSLGGGSINIKAGAGITIVRTGSGVNGIATISAESLVDTDEQDLSFSGASSPFSLNITNGDGVTFSQEGIIVLTRTVNDLKISAFEIDGDTLNELQVFSHGGTGELLSTLSLNGGSINIKAGTGISVVRSGSGINGIATISSTIVDTDTDTDDQNLIYVGTQTGVTTIDINDGTDVTLSPGTNILFNRIGSDLNISATYVDTDSQSLRIINDTLYITRGNFVDLIPYLDDTDTDTDSQSIYIAGNTLYITRGNSVDLSQFIDDTDTDTDSQSVYLVGNVLHITRGNTVDLSQFLDDTDTDTDDQGLSFVGASSPVTLAIDNGSSVIITAGTNINLNQVGNNLTINSTYVDTDTDNYVDALNYNTVNGLLTVGRTGVLPDLTVTVGDADWFLRNSTSLAMSIDSAIWTNNNVGINDTTPDASLDLVGIFDITNKPGVPYTVINFIRNTAAPTNSAFNSHTYHIDFSTEYNDNLVSSRLEGFIDFHIVNMDSLYEGTGKYTYFVFGNREYDTTYYPLILSRDTAYTAALRGLNESRIDHLAFNTNTSKYGQRRHEINELSDILYKSDLRFYIQVSDSSEPNGKGGSIIEDSTWFDNDYSTGYTFDASDNVIIRIHLADTGEFEPTGVIEPNGKLYISFLDNDFDNYSNNDTILVFGVHNGVQLSYTASKVDVSTDPDFRVYQYTVLPNPDLSEIRIEVTTNTNPITITDINYIPFKQQTQRPYLSKYTDNTLVTGLELRSWLKDYYGKKGDTTSVLLSMGDSVRWAKIIGATFRGDSIIIDSTAIVNWKFHFSGLDDIYSPTQIDIDETIAFDGQNGIAVGLAASGSTVMVINGAQLQWTLAATTGTPTLIGNAGASETVLLQGGAGISTNIFGNTVTFSVTDQSNTNEAQSWSNSSTATTYTGTLSNVSGIGGGSITIAEGSGIDLSYSLGTLTISSVGDGDSDPTNEYQYLFWSGSNPVATLNINSSPGLNPSITAGSGLSISSLSSTNITITAIDNSATNEIDTWNLGANASYTNISNGENVDFVGASGITTSRSLNQIIITGSYQGLDFFNATSPITLYADNSADGVMFSQGSGIVISMASDVLTISATDNSATNEIQGLSFSGTSGTITLDISGSVNDVQFIPGDNITFTATSTGITINAAGASYSWLLNANNDVFGSTTISSGNTVSVSGINGILAHLSGSGSTTLNIDGLQLQWILAANTGLSTTIGNGVSSETVTIAGINQINTSISLNTVSVGLDLNGCVNCVTYINPGNADLITTDAPFFYQYDEGFGVLNVPMINLTSTNPGNNATQLNIAANGDERVFISSIESFTGTLTLSTTNLYHRVLGASTINLPSGLNVPVMHYVINDGGYNLTINRTSTNTINGTTSISSSDKLIVLANSGNGQWVATTSGSGGGLTGSGVTNYAAIWTGSTSLGTGLIQDNSSTVGIGGLNASYEFFVADGHIKIGDAPGELNKIYFGDGNFVYVGESGADDRLYLRGGSLSIDVNGSLGTSGYVLTSNGSTASWQPSAAGSYSLSTSSISNTTTLVGSGSTIQFSAGSGMSVAFSGVASSATLTFTPTDQSISNEGLFTTSAGSGTQTILTSNTNSSASSFTINAGSGLTVASETIGANGQITLQAVDQSATNELQSLSFSGGSIPSLNISGSTGVTFSGGTGVSLFGTGTSMSISVSDQSATNEAQTWTNSSSVANSWTGTLGNISGVGGGTFTLNVASPGLSLTYGANVINITNTGDLSSTNEYQDLSTTDGLNVATVNIENGVGFTITGGAGILVDATTANNITIQSNITGITGSGTANYIPKFATGTSLGNSIIQNTTDQIGINSAPDVNTDIQVNISQPGVANYIRLGSTASVANKIFFGDGYSVNIGEHESANDRLSFESASLRISIGGSTGTNGYVLTSNGTTASWLANNANQLSLIGSFSTSILINNDLGTDVTLNLGSGLSLSGITAYNATLNVAEVGSYLTNEQDNLTSVGGTLNISNIQGSGGTDVSFSGSGITITSPTSSTMLFTAADLNNTNEAQSLTSSGTSSFTSTLSAANGAGGGSFTLASGNNITISRSLDVATIAQPAFGSLTTGLTTNAIMYVDGLGTPDSDPDLSYNASTNVLTGVTGNFTNINSNLTLPGYAGGSGYQQILYNSNNGGLTGFYPGMIYTTSGNANFAIDDIHYYYTGSGGNQVFINLSQPGQMAYVSNHGTGVLTVNAGAGRSINGLGATITLDPGKGVIFFCVSSTIISCYGN